MRLRKFLQMQHQRKTCKGNTAIFLLECQRRVSHWLEKPGHGFSNFPLLPCGGTLLLFLHQWNSLYPVLMQSKWKRKEREGDLTDWKVNFYIFQIVRGKNSWSVQETAQEVAAKTLLWWNKCNSQSWQCWKWWQWGSTYGIPFIGP